MRSHIKGKHLWSAIVALALSCTVSPAFGQSKVMGKVELEGATKADKTSGVWIDGQYVGYLKELKGSKKVLLLPGEHAVSVRQAGYLDYTKDIVVEPGQTQFINVAMLRDPEAIMPRTTAELKVDVEPKRAAVFVDDAFLGHAGELGGAFHSMLISPGRHQIKVELPGYRTFTTQVNLIAGQKAEIKTDLVPGSIEQAGPLIKESMNRY